MKLDIKKVCIKCGAKCCKFAGPTVSEREKNKILKVGFKDYFIKCKNSYDLKTKNGVCPYLKNNLCEIHKVKPLMCRAWPAFPVFKGKKKRIIILDCPLVKYLNKSDLNKLKKEAAKLPKELVEEPLEQPLFILKRLEKFHWEEKIKQALE